MKMENSLCIMKYECTFIIYKENKHMNVAYNVKQNNYEKMFFNEIRDTKRSLFWLLTQSIRLGISKIMSKTIATNI